MEDPLLDLVVVEEQLLVVEHLQIMLELEVLAEDLHLLLLKSMVHI
jgi:hypothetical protein